MISILRAPSPSRPILDPRRPCSRTGAEPMALARRLQCWKSNSLPQADKPDFSGLFWKAYRELESDPAYPHWNGYYKLSSPDALFQPRELNLRPQSASFSPSLCQD